MEKEMLQQHVVLDTVLQYLIEKNEYVYTEKIWTDLYSDVNQELFYFTLRRLTKTNDEIVKSIVHSDDIENYQAHFKANELTKYFLNDGGFTAVYEQEQKNKAIKELTEQKSREKLSHDLRIAKWQVIKFWPISIFGLFGGLYAIYEIFKLLFE